MTQVIRWRVFALAAVAINLAAFLMVRVAPRPAVEVGAALDVAVTVPVLYFLLIVRAGVMPLISMLPVCLLGMLRAVPCAGDRMGAPSGGGRRGTRPRGVDRGAGTSGLEGQRTER